MKEYKVWQMKADQFRRLSGLAYGFPLEEGESDVTSLSDFDLTFTCQLEGGILENLNRIYHHLNQDDRPTRTITHSLSIGDLIQVGLEFYRVAPFGFDLISIAQ